MISSLLLRLIESTINREGADGKTVATYAVATTSRSASKAEGDEWWRYVSLKSPKLAQWSICASSKLIQFSEPPFSKRYFGEG